MKDARTWGLLVFGATLIACSLVGGQERQPLQYHISAVPHRLVGGVAWKSLEPSSERPEGAQLRDFRSENPFFFKWVSPRVPNGFLWIALGRGREGGPYDRLIVDTNADGRLDDETAGGADSSEQASTSGPVKVVFEDKEGPVTCYLNFTYTVSEDGPRLSVSSGGWCEGTITVGGKRKHCVLIDQNTNGTFDDRSIDFDDCDLIQIAEEEVPDLCLVGKFMEVDGKLYELEVARDGAWIRLALAEDVRFGTVKQHAEMTELVAGGENGMLTLKMEKGLGKLPVGKYRVYQWVIERKGEGDDAWTLKATSFGNRGVFEVSEGQDTTLALGEPIVSGFDVRQSDPWYVIKHHWRGKSGEYIQLSRNGVPLHPPKFHIRNADRSYDRTFAFARGCPGGCPFSWKMPKNREGPFTVMAGEAGIPFLVENETYTICRVAAE